MHSITTTLILSGTLLVMTALANGQDIDIQQQAEIVSKVDRQGVGHKQAVQAISELGKVEKDRLPEMLKSMDGMSLLASNWMRGAVESVAGKPGDLPIEELIAFLQEPGHSGYSRRVAYELIIASDPGMSIELLPTMMNDESLENRRDAVQWYLNEIEAGEKSGISREEAIAGYQTALDAARDILQIEKIIRELGTRGIEASITQRLGFVTDWHVIAPFDNTDQSGFDVAYPPESSVNLEESLPGKTGEISWIKLQTDDRMGKVDLAAKLDKFKGAIAYAYTDFVSSEDQSVEIRIGTPNAHKLWINGELVVSNEIYHAGTSVDQYRGPIKLKKGRNTILVKICQNEQDQQWAQDWTFQIRICDSTGKAIHSRQRTDKNI